MKKNKKQIDDIMRMRGEGYTQKAIAEALNVSQPRVNKIIKAHKITGSKQIPIAKIDDRFQNIFNESDAQKLKDLWDSGINIARIAAMELATEIPDNVIDETNEDRKGKAIANYSAMVDIGRTRTIGGAALVEMVKKLEAQAKNNAMSLKSTKNKICLSTGATEDSINPNKVRSVTRARSILQGSMERARRREILGCRDCANLHNERREASR